MKLAVLFTVCSLLLVTGGCSNRKSTKSNSTLPTRRIGLQPQKRANTTKKPASRTVTAQANAPAIPLEELTPPALQAMTTPAERDALARAAQASISRARLNLSTLKVRGSAAMRATEIGRVESFVRQAEEALRADRVASARDLAHRAEVLSEDLLKR